MSKFREVRQENKAAAEQRARPSALQVAWLVVLVAFAGLLLWLTLAEPPTTTAIAETQPPVAQIDPAPADKPTATKQTAEAAQSPAQPPAQTAVQKGEDKPSDKAADKKAADAALQRPDAPASIVLTPAPIAELVDTTPNGPLPKITAGREPWQAYARPYTDTGAKPRIAIVISGLGLNKSLTDAAIQNLPPTVSFAFSPYAEQLTDRLAAARTAGHEALLMVPMEPHNYPKNDPGPHSLLTTLSAADNMKRLHWVLSRTTGYVGLLNDMGSRFTASEEAMTPVLQELKDRGILFMDARTSQYSVGAKLARNLRTPRAINNRYIDNTATEEDIAQRLQELESLAKAYGAAAGVGRLYPVTLRTVATWAEGLSARGFELVPLTAVANRQPVR